MARVRAYEEATAPDFVNCKTLWWYWVIAASNPVTKSVRLSPGYLCEETMRLTSVAESLALSRDFASAKFIAGLTLQRNNRSYKPRLTLVLYNGVTVQGCISTPAFWSEQLRRETCRVWSTYEVLLDMLCLLLHADPLRDTRNVFVPKIWRALRRALRLY